MRNGSQSGLNMTDPNDIIEKLVVADLKWHYEKFDPERHNTVPFVSMDDTEEAKYVRKMRKALKRVLEFYGEKT